MKERGKGQKKRGKGGVSLLLPLAFSLLLLPLHGCGKHKKHDKASKGDAGGKKGKGDKDDVAVKSIGVGPGDTTVWQTSAPNSLPSFSVFWTSGVLNSASGSLDTGHLVAPHGQIFQNGKPTSNYRSDTGDARRADKRLNMRDHVWLQSIDKTQTLTADQGEYRGDVKLVRAMGNVVAKGPFGTLSGSPELWATPDLRLIGTPDMVAKKLKLPALATLAATAALGSAQLSKGTDYKFENQGPQQYENLGKDGLRITVDPVKGKLLVVHLISRNMTITSVGTVVILTDPKGKEVRHMTSQGTVHVVQLSDTGTTTLDGNGSVYDVPPGSETGTLKVGGRVTLTSESHGKDAKGKVTTQTTVSKGDRGQALLLVKPPKDTNGLKEAILDGNVTIDSNGSPDDTFNGTGNHLVYTPRGEIADADLTGDAVLTRTTVGKDEQGKPTNQVVVGRGQVAHAVLDAKSSGAAAPAGITKTAGDRNPLKNATLTGGTVTIDVTGSDGQTFKGLGDKVVYTATGGGNGKAVMTGDLKFSGDAPDYLSDVQGSDVATVLIDKNGWKTVNLSNSNGEGTTTNIETKTPPSVKHPDASKSGKKKKGGKG